MIGKLENDLFVILPIDLRIVKKDQISVRWWYLIKTTMLLFGRLPKYASAYVTNLDIESSIDKTLCILIG